jgi:hypothetical protein
MHFDAAHLMMLAAAAQTIVAAVRIEIVRALQANPLHPFQWHRCHIVNPDGYRSQLIGFGMCCAKNATICMATICEIKGGARSLMMRRNGRMNRRNSCCGIMATMYGFGFCHSIWKKTG